MKICSQCGQINDDDARFCVRDGWKLPDSVDEANQEDKPNSKVCEKCGFQNNSESKFCGGCGRPLGESMKKKEKDINIYYEDNRHQNEYGAYLSAACHVRSMFNIDVTKSTEYCGLDEAKCKTLLEVAKNIG